MNFPGIRSNVQGVRKTHFLGGLDVIDAHQSRSKARK